MRAQRGLRSQFCSNSDAEQPAVHVRVTHIVTSATRGLIITAAGSGESGRCGWNQSQRPLSAHLTKLVSILAGERFQGIEIGNQLSGVLKQIVPVLVSYWSRPKHLQSKNKY